MRISIARNVADPAAQSAALAFVTKALGAAVEGVTIT
jgi:hypothetical protein